MCNATWCPQCGPDVRVDEDGCCALCGADAMGAGADEADRLRARVAALTECLRGYVTNCEQCSGTNEVSCGCFSSCVLFNSVECPSETPENDALRCPTKPCPACAAARAILDAHTKEMEVSK